MAEHKITVKLYGSDTVDLLAEFNELMMVPCSKIRQVKYDRLNLLARVISTRIMVPKKKRKTKKAR